MRSKRFEKLAGRPVNKETFILPWHEAGLINVGSPNDPQPSIKIEDGKVTEIDGVSQDDFDLIDHFIAQRAINLKTAERSMNMPSIEIARMLADINVSRNKILELVSGCTPAKLVEVVLNMNVLEMMMGLTKMRARIINN
jgi:propanediol dehydratase large subunit